MKFGNYSEVTVDLSQDELAKLLTTATRGNERLGVYIDFANDNNKKGDKCEGYEDRCAKRLLNGGYIVAYDKEAYNVYGSVCESYVDDEGDGTYKLTLERIKRGIVECLFSEDEYINECACWFIHKSNILEMDMADTIMQQCMFGTVYYA